MRRITNGYMRLLNSTLKEYLPAIMAAYKEERRGDSRYDDARDLLDKLKQEFEKIAKKLEQEIANFGLSRRIASAARMVKNNSFREWKRVVHDTLGINLLDDYYKGDFYEQVLRRWIDENVLKIQSIPTETMGEMQRIIQDGFTHGQTIRDITKAIQVEYNLKKSKAASLARDQIGTLNAQITRIQQEDAGCSQYRWSDSHDSRVRDCHKELNGKIFAWNDPPEMWYETKSRGRVYTGRHCHPGEDFCCRCCAIPVFNLETVDVPMQAKKTKE